MLDTNFKWSDELVRQFLFFNEVRNSDNIEEFKKSKEKDIPKWEILELHSYGNERRYLIDGLYRIFKDGVGFELDYLLNRKDTKIIAVIRYSDNVVFTIGDKTDKGIIKRFDIYEGNLMYVVTGDGSVHSLRSIEKVKPKEPLFTTEDGVEIFGGDKYTKVGSAFSLSSYWATDGGTYDPNYTKLTFSTEEKAKEYILQNKPIQVSYKELREFYLKEFNHGMPRWEIVLDFFKSKINP